MLPFAYHVQQSRTMSPTSFPTEVTPVGKLISIRTLSNRFTLISPIQRVPSHFRLRVPPHFRLRVQPHLRLRVRPHLRLRVRPHLRLRVLPHLRLRVPPHLRQRVPPHLRQRVPPHLRLRVPPHFRSRCDPSALNVVTYLCHCHLRPLRTETKQSPIS